MSLVVALCANAAFSKLVPSCDVPRVVILLSAILCRLRGCNAFAINPVMLNAILFQTLSVETTDTFCVIVNVIPEVAIAALFLAVLALDIYVNALAADKLCRSFRWLVTRDPDMR
jgi:hypothetical protein